MKKFISWLLALAMICSLAACAAPQGPVQTPVPTAAASPSALPESVVPAGSPRRLCQPPWT